MNQAKEYRKKLCQPELIALAALLLYPVFPIPDTYGAQLTTIFIFAILALGLNVVMGWAGILHLGIAAFFGIGAYLTGILTVPSYPFQTGFIVALVVATAGTAVAGVLLGVPTLRLRGDYLALVTLGFGEVVRFSLRNLEEITGGTRSLNPIPSPGWFGLDWAVNYRPFYYLCLLVLAAVVVLLRNLDNSRLGRAWHAIREDELAATCMGINAARVKLAAVAVGSGLAGLAGCLYATKLTTTAGPDAYDFSRSIIVMCCVIVGGMGSIRGTLVGVLILIGYDNILTPVLDGWIQAANINPHGSVFLSFSNWRLMIFGVTLILIVRFRPKGLVPSKRLLDDFRSEYCSEDSILSEETIF
jgi:branched-chain amino acid transport system permease protein